MTKPTNNPKQTTDMTDNKTYICRTCRHGETECRMTRCTLTHGTIATYCATAEAAIIGECDKYQATSAPCETCAYFDPSDGIDGITPDICLGEPTEEEATTDHRGQIIKCTAYYPKLDLIRD